jgi:transcriptional regulator with XRE-family HTH domain
MSADPLSRLVPAFADMFARHRAKQNWTIDAFATATGLSALEISSLEGGCYGPTLLDFFRIARALGEAPSVLLLGVIEAWRADPADILHQSRPSDFARLFRLGYHHKPGDFRELPNAYYSVAESTHAAGKLNAQRHTRGVALLDTVCIYVSLRPDSGEGAP